MPSNKKHHQKHAQQNKKKDAKQVQEQKESKISNRAVQSEKKNHPEDSTTKNPPEIRATKNPPENTATNNPPENPVTKNPNENRATKNPPENTATNNLPENPVTKTPPENTVTKTSPENKVSEPVKEEEKPKKIEQPVELYVKHPLEDTWTLWYFQNDKALDWKKNQLEIATFQYIEDFWCLYDHIKKASELKQGTDYSLFKAGVTPMWEDPLNKNGGRWIINLTRGPRNDVDKSWLEILLLLIGATLTNTDQICGAVVNMRFRNDKIGVWTKDYLNSGAVIEIGRKIKDVLKIPYSNVLRYEAHIDNMDKKNINARYTV